MATSPTSKSAPLSNAAKDDALGSDGDFTFTIADLLANDAGGAKANTFFFGSGDNGGLTQAQYMSAHGIVANLDGSYTATGGDFEYSVQIGRGTWSTAAVDVAHLSGKELLANWDFEQDNADNANGFVDLAVITGWNNEEGTSQPMQVQHESFGFVKGFAEGEDQWLDTSASAGNIHIGQDFDLAEGATAKLSVSVAAEDILYNNGTTNNIYQPDADDHLQFLVNDEVVLDITLADYKNEDGTFDWNQFQDFTVDVTGQAGTDHFEIQTTGMDQYTDGDGVIHGYAGFAVDHVSLQEWVI